LKCYGHLVDKVYKNKRELPFLFERIQEFYKMGDIKYSQSNFSPNADDSRIYTSTSNVRNHVEKAGMATTRRRQGRQGRQGRQTEMSLTQDETDNIDDIIDDNDNSYILP